jgi:hypothetical protein
MSVIPASSITSVPGAGTSSSAQIQPLLHVVALKLISENNYQQNPLSFQQHS